VLKVDWNPINNLIISCSEDCKYKVRATLEVNVSRKARVHTACFMVMKMG